MRARLQGLEAPPAPTAASSAVEAPLETAAQELARQKEEWRAHMAEVEIEYQLEGRDPAWAREAQGVISRAIDGLPALSKSIRSLECRSETCRLEVVDDHQPDVEKQIPLLPLGLAGLPSVQFNRIAEPDGKVRTILYLSRNADQPTAG